jgi:hypothetical protein
VRGEFRVRGGIASAVVATHPGPAGEGGR